MLEGREAKPNWMTELDVLFTVMVQGGVMETCSSHAASTYDGPRFCRA